MRHQINRHFHAMGMTGLILLVSFTTYAAGTAQTDYTFKGSLKHLVQCTVNHGNPIEVSFGNINAAIASGHTTPLTYSLACVGNSPGNTVTMKLDAAQPGPGDTKAMGTTLPGLDIVLLKDGHRQDIGQAFTVALDALPELALQLEIMPGVTPDLNEFEATGTLTAEYQ